MNLESSNTDSQESQGRLARLRAKVMAWVGAGVTKNMVAASVDVQPAAIPAEAWQAFSREGHPDWAVSEPAPSGADRPVTALPAGAVLTANGWESSFDDPARPSRKAADFRPYMKTGVIESPASVASTEVPGLASRAGAVQFSDVSPESDAWRQDTLSDLVRADHPNLPGPDALGVIPPMQNRGPRITLDQNGVIRASGPR